MNSPPNNGARQHLWIVGQYATVPWRGKLCRQFLLARQLVKQGVDVTLIGGSGHHFHQEPPEYTGPENAEYRDGVKIVWVPTSKARQTQHRKRVAAWFAFARGVTAIADKLERPTIILQTSPSLIPYFWTWRLARRYNIQIFFEFRDIWPLTLMEIGKFSKFHPLILLHTWLERHAVRSADRVIHTMEYGYKRVEELGASSEKAIWLPHGCGDGIDDEHGLRLTDPIAAAFEGDHLKLVYIGSIGLANAIDLFIDAAALCRDLPVHFYIFGDGAERETLEAKATKLELAKVHFLGSVPKSMVTSVHQAADALIISWHDSPLYRYGSFANKTAEYLAAGKPIIQAYSGDGDIIARTRAGLTVPAYDTEAFANAVRQFCTMSEEERRELGKNGRSFARENLTFPALAAKLRREIFED